MSEPLSLLEGNRAAVRRFKEAQGTRDEAAALRKLLAPNYTRLRGGMANLAANARGQGFPEPGAFLRAAFPDRVDVIEDTIAEEDRVGLLWRLTGTHAGNLFGLPPTGRRCEMAEVGIATFVGDTWVEGWYLADGVGILLQIGALHMLAGMGCKALN
ncbi:MAG: ester cyclase [Betaproteobacteria bacterium]|nr:ester cyclase [Betaproteobacteria bacterium]